MGVCLNGVELLPCVSQGAAPLGREMTVTAAEDNVIYELAGRPAVQAIEQAVAELPLDERALVAAGLLIGIVIDGGKPEYEQGDFLVRGVTGADPESGAITVGRGRHARRGGAAARPRRALGRRGPAPRAAAAGGGDRRSAAGGGAGVLLQRPRARDVRRRATMTRRWSRTS